MFVLIDLNLLCSDWFESSECFGLVHMFQNWNKPKVSGVKNPRRQTTSGQNKLWISSQSSNSSLIISCGASRLSLFFMLHYHWFHTKLCPSKAPHSSPTNHSKISDAKVKYRSYPTATEHILLITPMDHQDPELSQGLLQVLPKRSD
jgi:hypothetical protein